jgi:transcriptional regulator with XRE-family HTH domain
MATKAERHAGGRPRTLKRSPFGQKIETLAARRGMHLDELAAAAGIRGPTLYRILTGRIAAPKVDTVLALARALGVKIDSLVN